MDDDEFTLAVSGYRVNSCLLVPGMVFEEDDLPVLLNIDIRSDIGGVRELIGNYIQNVRNGIIMPDCNHNWILTGYDWDEDLHAQAVELVEEGKLTILSSEDGRCTNIASITVDDLRRVS